ncbi:hypothetical protein GGX14DRAFT_545727 [Mycena pura]|uniref:DUF6534 domain-containing protein n=1 Tax=Mycena pura TaxID=153505 RepID=A0AAD6UW89_9AGAR|nr:hypothetical protein GGX14DRAFT_545727 [Mycena pura]
MDVAQTVILTHHGWWWIITAWCTPAMFTQVVWSGICIPFLSGLISAVVQIFYSRRIWILTKPGFMHAVCVLIVLLAVMQSTIAMVSALIVSQNPVLPTLLGLSREFSTWLAGSLVVDIIITVCMSYILVQAKNNTSWGPTESMLTRLINRLIQSGAATVMLAAISLALFVQIPETNYYYVPYTNSLMLNLNLRRPNGSYITEQASTGNVLPLSPLRSEGVHVRVEHATHNDIKWTSAVVVDPSSMEHNVNIHKID